MMAIRHLPIRKRANDIRAKMLGRARALRPDALPLSSLTNVAAFETPQWFQMFADLGTYSYENHIFGNKKAPNLYRKGWEWTQTIYGLQKLDMIKPQHRAIGVGAGRECVIFWLGDRLTQVVATDLYGGEEWATEGAREADAAVLNDPQQFCPRPIRRDAIEFRVMDGTDLSYYADGTFDIAWSLSSIEHFGGHARSADAMREMARVVRSGGVIAVATEYLLLPDQTHAEYFNRAQIEEHVIHGSPSLQLVEPIDWSLPPQEYLVDSIVYPHAVDRARRHIVLNDGSVQWTSFLAFFRKR
jgi:SAM-dependent methyltransferase